MMQRLKTRVYCSAEHDRKLAFLRHRRTRTLDRSHRMRNVENVQYKDRGEALDKTGLPKL